MRTTVDRPEDVQRVAASIARDSGTAHLGGLAGSRGARLATPDHGLAALHSDVADLLETGPASR